MSDFHPKNETSLSVFLKSHLGTVVQKSKKFKPSTEPNSLRVTDFTKTKKVGILTRNHDLDRTKISTIINEI